MKLPRLIIDTEAIKHNAGLLSQVLGRSGVSVVGVVKGVSGHPDVARAMISGGVASIGDSRVENIRRLRESGYLGETVLLRAPGPSRCREVVALCDVSLNSHLDTVKLLNEEALSMGKTHKVILMVELGDLREGVLPEDAAGIAREIEALRGVELAGIGANLACYGGVIPTPDKMSMLLAVKEEIEKAIGRPLQRISGGNSANLLMALDGKMPRGITELRLGESILLGRESTRRIPIPGCRYDAFLLQAEVIEVISKPSVPVGEIGQDASGKVPQFVDRGWRRRAICAIGRQDVDPDGLTPVDPGVLVLGASSDHLICDVEEASALIRPGDVLEFLPDYMAVLRLSTSPYVEKVVK